MEIEWQGAAKRQIQEIFDYYNSVAGMKIARKVVRKIVERPRIIVRNPEAGEREWLLEDLSFEYRRLIEGDYKIVYRVDDNKVMIVAVWDCRRDPADLCQNIINIR